MVPSRGGSRCSFGETRGFGKNEDGVVLWDQSHSQKCTNRKKAESLGALKISTESDDFIFDEIHRRDRLEDEEFEDEMEEEEDEGELEDQ